jgi:hypothetical protein
VDVSALACRWSCACCFHLALRFSTCSIPGLGFTHITCATSSTTMAQNVQSCIHGMLHSQVSFNCLLSGKPHAVHTHRQAASLASLTFVCCSISQGGLCMCMVLSAACCLTQATHACCAGLAVHSDAPYGSRFVCDACACLPFTFCAMHLPGVSAETAGFCTPCLQSVVNTGDLGWVACFMFMLQQQLTLPVLAPNASCIRQQAQHLRNTPLK